MKKFRSIIWVILFIIFLFILIFSIAGFFTGSLELSPTVEQDEKARIAYGVFSAVSAGVLLFLVFIRRKRKN